MRVFLAIDPGFSVTGYAIGASDGRSLTLLHCHILKFSSAQPIPVRLAAFYDAIEAHIVKHGITDLALETPFLGKNAQNFLKLGYLRGALMLLAQRHNLTLHEFSPRAIKSSVTGYGAADKEQVARAVKFFFPRFVLETTASDATDALALLLCATTHARLSLLHAPLQSTAS